MLLLKNVKSTILPYDEADVATWSLWLTDGEFYTGINGERIEVSSFTTEHSSVVDTEFTTVGDTTGLVLTQERYETFYLQDWTSGVTAEESRICDVEVKYLVDDPAPTCAGDSVRENVKSSAEKNGDKYVGRTVVLETRTIDNPNFVDTPDIYEWKEVSQSQKDVIAGDTVKSYTVTDWEYNADTNEYVRTVLTETSDYEAITAIFVEECVVEVVGVADANPDPECVEGETRDTDRKEWIPAGSSVVDLNEEERVSADLLVATEYEETSQTRWFNHDGDEVDTGDNIVLLRHTGIGDWSDWTPELPEAVDPVDGMVTITQTREIEYFENRWVPMQETWYKASAFDWTYESMYDDTAPIAQDDIGEWRQTRNGEKIDNQPTGEFKTETRDFTFAWTDFKAQFPAVDVDDNMDFGGLLDEVAGTADWNEFVAMFAVDYDDTVGEFTGLEVIQ